MILSFFFFFFNDTATTEIYTLSLHDALPIRPGDPGRPLILASAVSRSAGPPQRAASSGPGSATRRQARAAPASSKNEPDPSPASHQPTRAGQPSWTRGPKVSSATPRLSATTRAGQATSSSRVKIGRAHV